MTLDKTEPRRNIRAELDSSCRNGDHCWTAWSSAQTRVRLETGVEIVGYHLERHCLWCGEKETA